MELAMSTSHHFSLGSLIPQKKGPGGSRSDATKSNFPALNGMALSLLHLDPKGVREPHWHPNASELSYCLEGSGVMTIFSPGNCHDTFTIEPGSICFVPIGCIHHIENTGQNPLRMVLCFNHEQPEDQDLSSGVAAMPKHIMAETCGLTSSFFEGFKMTLKEAFVFEMSSQQTLPASFMTNRFKMDLQNTNPQISVEGGTVKMSNNFLMPTLQGLAVYSLILTPRGGREPHWHPNASELNYLASGRARISLLSPGGSVNTFDMEKGDISFLPQGYLHYIENIGDEDAHFAIFFNHAAPSDIGFSGCFGAFRNDLFAALFGVPSNYFDHIPKYQKDRLIISGEIPEG
jgi:oxalate decarboxylase